MDEYLTNGTRSIPVLVCRNSETGADIGWWGPRPVRVIEHLEQFKHNKLDYTSAEFKKELHLFYSLDKGKAICEDLLNAIRIWKND